MPFLSSDSELEDEQSPPKLPVPKTSLSSTTNSISSRGDTSWTSTSIWTALVLFRCLNALSLRTFFQPDEYFQSLEPAWRIAFGSESGAWITWEWHHQLRSSLHPVLFAAIYFVSDKIIKLVHLTPHYQSLILANVPNQVQALIAATGDFYTWKLSERIHGNSSGPAWVTLLMTVLSPWQWFCSTRTFSNSLETTLTIAALYYWPQVLWTTSSNLNKNRGVPPKAAKILGFPSFSIPIKDLRISLLLAATACILRPTNLLIWLGITLPLAINLGNERTRLRLSEYTILIQEVVLCGISILLVSAVSDRLYFKQWTFPPYQWLNFNISQDLAVFYGRNDWHYYLSQGLPLLLITYIPFTLIGLWKSTSIQGDRPSFVLSSTVLLTIGTLSTISHKEVRFIYPLLPLLHVIAAPVLATFFIEDKEHSTTRLSFLRTSSIANLKRKPILLIMLFLNITVAWYTSTVHQTGVLDVLSFLRNDFEAVTLVNESSRSNRSFSPDEAFVGFLMPCHSTPWRSKLIYPELKAWALSCEPPIHLAARTEERKAYRDEADRFYDGPLTFLKDEIGTGKRPWPRYIAGFAGIEDDLRKYFESDAKGKTVQEKWRGKNSDWHDDWRRVGDVVVWELVKTDTM